MPSFSVPFVAAVVVIAVFSGVASAAQNQTGGLVIPHIGTRLIPVPNETQLPFDKPYEKLTAAEKNLVRSKYESLGPNDEPPYPIGGMHTLSDEVAKVQQRVLANGRFQAAAHVEANGRASKVSIYALPDERLKDVLSYILLNAQYKPAKCNGKPCAMDFLVDFNLETATQPKPPLSAPATKP
jgi:hypothetical protein